jgi:hypothetical protein
VVLTKMDDGGIAPPGTISTSAHRGHGLDALRAELATRVARLISESLANRSRD